MAFNFPTSPALNDIYTEGSRSWRFNGTSWKSLSSSIVFGDGPGEVAEGGAPNKFIQLVAGGPADYVGTYGLVAHGSIEKSTPFTSGTGFCTIDPRLENHIEVTVPISGSFFGFDFDQDALDSIQNQDYIWEGSLSFTYTSGSVEFFTGAVGFTVEWENNQPIVPVPSTYYVVKVTISGTTNEIRLLKQNVREILTDPIDTIYIDASDFIPRVTDGCGTTSSETATNRINRNFLLFDQTATEYAQATFTWPAGWNTAAVRFHWTSTAAPGGQIRMWSQIRIFNDLQDLDNSFGSAVAVTDTYSDSSNIHVTNSTTGITPAGSTTAGNPAIIQIYRDNSISLNIAADVWVSGITIAKSS